MKKLNYLASFLIAAILLGGCAGIDRMQEEYSTVTFTTTPQVLEMHGGEVEYSIEGSLPPEWFNEDAIVEFTPVLTYEGGEMELESKTFQGEDVEANNQVISQESGGTIEFNGSFTYEDDMRVSQLVMRGTVSEAEGDESFDLPDRQIAKGTKATPNLVQIDPKPAMAGDNWERVTYPEQFADIHYVIERTNVRESELEKEDIQQLENFVEEVEKATNKAYDQITLHGYASPDGPMDLNERLSQGRQESANKYLDGVIDKKQLSEDEAQRIYEGKATTEDWEGFKELVQESDIQDKDLILRVLNMYSDPEVREKELKNMTETFEVLAEDILPKLRRTDMTIRSEKEGLSDAEIKNFIYSQPDTIDLEAALYAGNQLFEDLDQKLRAYELAAEKAPNCLRAHSNIAAVHIKQGNINEAHNTLERANEIKQGVPFVLNNLGAVELEQGNVEEAKEYFLDATDAGEPVEYNLGIVNIIQGDYDAALNYLQNKETFNTALAMVLSGDQSGAENMLYQVDDTAMSNYLEAVIAARNNDQEGVFSNLRTAIQNDASLAEMAATDMEFVEYMENETFNSIVE
ncbi:MAG: tetratricopeptide repeat protein [Bacteroidales bacterium]